MAQDPGRVFPGKKMSGQMGNVTTTVQNLIVARVDTERGLLLVRGAVPGSKGGDVVVTPSVKMRLKPIKAAPAAKPEDAKAAKAAAPSRRPSRPAKPGSQGLREDRSTWNSKY